MNKYEKRLRWLSPEQISSWHEDLLGRKDKNNPPEWTRVWLMQAVTPQTLIYEAYRQNGWDLESEVKELRTEFRADCDYFVENAASDLRQMRRRLLRRYAFWASWHVESEAWKREQETLDSKAAKRERLNLLLFRFWRMKDGLILRLGIAVQLGFAVLASSSGLTQSLNADKLLNYWGVVLALELLATFFLALVDVQKQVGRRDWAKVLGVRALIVTGAGALWAVPGGLLYYWIAPSLHSSARSVRYYLLCSSTAVLLGFIFQLFWQEDSIAEPL